MKEQIKEERKEGKQNYFTYILAGILLLVCLGTVNLFTRVQKLEEKVTGVKQAVTQAQAQPTTPPKAQLTVSDTDPSMGPKDAKVTLILFSDFLCPYCGAYSGDNKTIVQNMQSRDKTWQAPLPNIIKDYVETGKVRFVWKDLAFHGDPAILAASAARCAMEQGKFWEYHSSLFKQQASTATDAFSKENLKKLAVNLKLNTSDFNTCLDSGKYTQKIQDALAYGKSVGVDGTPATFVNGTLIPGAAPYSQFKTAIEAELKK